MLGLGLFCLMITLAACWDADGAPIRHIVFSSESSDVLNPGVCGHLSLVATFLEVVSTYLPDEVNTNDHQQTALRILQRWRAATCGIELFPLSSVSK